MIACLRRPLSLGFLSGRSFLGAEIATANKSRVGGAGGFAIRRSFRSPRHCTDPAGAPSSAWGSARLCGGSSVAGLPRIERTVRLAVGRFSTAQAPISSDTERPLRLSQAVAKLSGHHNLSRRQAELLIRKGNVAVNDRVVKSPQFDLNSVARYGTADTEQSTETALPDHPLAASNGRITISLHGRTFASADSVAELLDRFDARQKQLQIVDTDEQNSEPPRVWAAHKTKGELVSHSDPFGRRTLLERVQRGGLDKRVTGGKVTLKPIGRLDMMTEGLILLTTCGKYAREMELPSSQLHRTYRVRVHGQITAHKLERLRNSGVFRWKVPRADDDGFETRQQYYGPMKVQLEAVPRDRNGNFKTRTNHWMQVTCREGKNRQIRNALASLGLSVTRLIRVSFGDYQLNTIPSGMVIPVPYKPVKSQLHKGKYKFDADKPAKKKDTEKPVEGKGVRWVEAW